MQKPGARIIKILLKHLERETDYVGVGDFFHLRAYSIIKSVSKANEETKHKDRRYFFSTEEIFKEKKMISLHGNKLRLFNITYYY